MSKIDELRELLGDNEDNGQKYSKIMLEFEDEIFEFQEVKKITKKINPDKESESGTSYDIVIHNRFAENVFKYPTEAIRDKRLEDLKEVMVELRALIIKI